MISEKIVKKEKHEELSLLKVSGTENLIFFSRIFDQIKLFLQRHHCFKTKSEEMTDSSA